ncbi:MAG: hypothetical protein R3E58_17060 [Phycisphaerae bacterium]
MFISPSLHDPPSHAVPVAAGQTEAHIQEALILAIGDIDGIIETIKKSPDSATAKEPAE